MTIVTVGRGDKENFWHSSWINGKAPKYIAQALLQKKEKCYSNEGYGAKQVDSHISPIQSFEELQKFIVLWEGVNTVNMMEYSEDEIKWKWTPDS